MDETINIESFCLHEALVYGFNIESKPKTLVQLGAMKSNGYKAKCMLPATKKSWSLLLILMKFSHDQHKKRVSTKTNNTFQNTNAR